jgi:hypothetical protein
VKLASSLTALAEELGYTDSLVKRVLAGKSPRERAAELISGTKVREVSFRRELYASDSAALLATADPMIELARSVDPEARELRKLSDAAEEQKRQAHATIERARFDVGLARVPDATFTLRLSYGTLRGYAQEGENVPAFTTIDGIYERSAAHGGTGPFELPERWQKGREELNRKTPFNFVSTHDITGGNSGSPVVNRANEFVGIIFDGNIQSLGRSFAYHDIEARAVSVDCRAIIEVLRKLYDAQHLVDELIASRR